MENVNMARTQRQWVYCPRPASHVPDAVKEQVMAKANEIIETLFKPRYIKPPPKNARFNYIVDIYTKWHKNCLLFRAKFACPGPRALSPFFEDSFTRLAYMANGRFNLAYMRHTGKWCEVFSDMSMEEAFAEIRDQPFFHPPG
jgi:hypothetical protein